MYKVSVIESYLANHVNRTRIVTEVSKKAQSYIHKYVDRNADKIVLSKAAMRKYTGSSRLVQY